MKFLKKIIELHKLHKRNCKEYKKIIETIFFKKKISSVEDLPFIPVNIFKSLDLMSIEKKKIYKIMRSSGTSGQN
jgi:phenylacetate-coenzyme A ligase PaaK-like adenylate-forming protein